MTPLNDSLTRLRCQLGPTLGQCYTPTADGRLSLDVVAILSHPELLTHEVDALTRVFACFIQLKHPDILAQAVADLAKETQP